MVKNQTRPRGGCTTCGKNIAAKSDGNAYDHADFDGEWCMGGPVIRTDNAPEPLAQQVERLAAFITAEVPGEPSQSQGAVDTAIRIIREAQANPDTDNAVIAGTGDYWSFTTTEQRAEAAQRRLAQILETPLGRWWVELAENDLAAVLPKAKEYSAYDLILVGRATGDMLGNQLTTPDEDGDGDRNAAEIACWFYILGKIGRAIGAIKEGRMPSRDTADDVRIYATMIARIKETGGWPNA
jgi:hypothetical protein